MAVTACIRLSYAKKTHPVNFPSSNIQEQLVLAALSAIWKKWSERGNRFDFPTGILNFETLTKRIITITIALAMALHAFAQSAPRPQLPETVAYSQRAKWGPLPAQGRSLNFVPSFFIYPDTKLDEQGARALVESLGMQGVLDEHHGSVFVVNPAGEKYADSDYEAFGALQSLMDRQRKGDRAGQRRDIRQHRHRAEGGRLHLGHHDLRRQAGKGDQGRLPRRAGICRRQERQEGGGGIRGDQRRAKGGRAAAPSGDGARYGIESTLYKLFEKYPQLNPSRVYAEGLSAGSMTATAQQMWDFFKLYSRDPETKELIYHGR